jgi:hypothetical protein
VRAAVVPHVVGHPQVGGLQERTLVQGPGIQQRADAAIGAGHQQEASTPLELSPGTLDRGSPKRRSQRLPVREGGIPDRPRNRRQAQRLGGQPVTACSALASREAKPFGELALSAIILGLLGEGLGGGVGEPAPRWALARHERQGARVQAQELIDVAGRQLDRQERRSGW